MNISNIIALASIGVTALTLILNFFFQKYLLDRNIRFTFVHKTQAEAIIEMYSMLIEAKKAFNKLIGADKKNFSDDEADITEAENRLLAYIDFAEKKLILFNKNIRDKHNNIVAEKKLFQFYVKEGKVHLSVKKIYGLIEELKKELENESGDILGI